ncbi:MAG TPA: DUF6794 domain-containing protein [Candidatus Acidoferrales bacterium]|nr:DUF6794 domain-containing protein [Candidatus Acidoferrales bacterium]
MITEKMKATVTAVFIIVLFASSAVADKPRTVDEAVQVLKTKWLQPKDRDWILRNTKDEVRNRLYMGFGTGVRNEFGLRGDNQRLHDSCGTKDPEGCSVVILDRLWESVREDADPALVHQLDCQFQLAYAIHVSLKGFHQLTTRAMIQRLQSQIDSQLPTLAASGVPGCQNFLTLDVAGEPDMGCFVVAPYHNEERKYWDDLTLDQALAVLGIRNLFKTVHYPPKITLDFLRKCQFPKPFPY